MTKEIAQAPKNLSVPKHSLWVCYLISYNQHSFSQGVSTMVQLRIEVRIEDYCQRLMCPLGGKVFQITNIFKHFDIIQITRL